MNKIRHALRNGFIAGLIMLLVGVVPVPATAQDGSNGPSNAASTEQTSDQPQTAQPAPPTNGTTGPTGAASWTYTYNEGSGLWENDYYTYDPATYETTPKVPLEYTYNPATGLWDTEIWQYSAAAGAYQKAPVSVTAPPSGAVTHGGPAEVLPEQPASDNQDSAASAVQQNAENGTAQNTAQNSTQPATAQPSGTTYTGPVGGNLNFSNSGTISDYLDSTAQSGNAIVIANTTAGNVNSGDATAMANIINLLQSQSALGGAGMATFTANIQGNVTGDFLIDPASYMQPANASAHGLTNLLVNTKNEGTINNNINLDATSGTAEAAQNTTVGNVTSGDANAIANVVNMINSVVAANQSFMGVINIHGDYTGNILMPTDSLNALLATAGSDGTTAVATDVNNTSDQNVRNDINLSAVSGNVTATENTTGGNVSTGDSLTNLTLLNLTGRQVVAANSLLVFVNVLGNWVGLIMDAPAGTTSAALGGGVTENSTAALAARNDITNTENFGIFNDINANANSGRANAAQNTTVGNVRSGDTTASANVANIIGSQFSLANWFGVLFINVFGTWRGNFGVAQAPVVPPITSGVSGPAAGPAEAIQDVRVFSFTEKPGPGRGGAGGSELQLSPLSEAAMTGSASSEEILENVSRVLSSTTGKGIESANTQNSGDGAPEMNWSGLAMVLGLAGLAYVGVDRTRTNLRNRRHTISR